MVGRRAVNQAVDAWLTAAALRLQSCQREMEKFSSVSSRNIVHSKRLDPQLYYGRPPPSCRSRSAGQEGPHACGHARGEAAGLSDATCFGYAGRAANVTAISDEEIWVRGTRSACAPAI
jgi:hypothetical protein